MNITNKTLKIASKSRQSQPTLRTRALARSKVLTKDKSNQYKFQIAKSKCLTQALVCIGVSRKCALIHWNLVFVSSIAYLLGVCHLSTTWLHNLQNKYIPVILNKMGFAQTYFHSIVFDPCLQGGIKIVDPALEQGIMIKHKVQSNTNNTNTRPRTGFPVNISIKVTTYYRYWNTPTNKLFT